VDFFKSCLQHVISVALKESHNIDIKAFKLFKRVCIWDSSGWQLRNGLKKEFPGCGGSATKAGCKLQYCYDFKSNSIVHFELTNGITPDQGYGKQQLAKEVEEGDLFLFDLGFFSLITFKEIDTRGGYYLSRLDPTVRLYSEGARFELLAFLKKNKEESCQEVTLEVGDCKIKSRLIAVKLPEEERKRRIRKMKKKAKERGTIVSQQRIQLAGWNLFMTNASKKKLSLELVYSFYKLRWSIEILFKQLKSQLNIDVSNHSNANRLKCEVYSTLIVSALINCAYNLLQRELWQKEKAECSLEKTFKFFANKAHLLLDITNGTITDITSTLSRLLQMAMRSCRQDLQPSRKSSLQAIYDI